MRKRTKRIHTTPELNKMSPKSRFRLVAVVLVLLLLVLIRFFSKKLG
ncbi:MAG: hypothetical protein JNL36_02785 [Candidatus Kapabacteria bacterium]|nr:hypothetical protein [Candidatus Kapabacteria bacterium]